MEKLVIGNTYYISCGTSNYRTVVLVKILNNKEVLLKDKKEKIFQCSVNRLHTVPYKAVSGHLAREGVKHQLNVMRKREEEKLVDKEIQKKIKKLGHSVYATMKNGKYTVRKYIGIKPPLFNTLKELEQWADGEFIKLEEHRKQIRLKGYKYLKIENKKGKSDYFQNLVFRFFNFEIKCRIFKGDVDEIPKDKVLNRSDVPEMKIIIAR